MLSGIYEINCQDCNAKYIGQTKRQLREREAEHNNLKNKESAISRHITETGHKTREINLVKKVDDWRKLDAYESFYLNKNRNCNLLNDQPEGNLNSYLYDFGQFYLKKFYQTIRNLIIAFKEKLLFYCYSEDEPNKFEIYISYKKRNEISLKNHKLVLSQFINY